MYVVDKWLILYARHRQFHAPEFDSEREAHQFAAGIVESDDAFFVACLRLTNHTRIVVDGLAVFCARQESHHYG